ncbi:ABC transporter permease [Dickeya solani]|uniref:ABC transporter permease n=1 Tax=Dickeya solani TaxID=1089444 RepID=A0ABU4EJY9_9GAMM|nr:ABC transporter permease [Dickeya solani]MCA6999739.1 ABC transporter permease [Dickeya solani]MCZ0820316.1 ABC transporter permease [Dickeya solani]MDV6993950.1 ABC transporter permease [Dickeya solani]MDV7005306.1 ABC transporter permease [Dickeya solani]MDV7039123.1 ABC transporter permease [Dickeya solani]
MSFDSADADSTGVPCTVPVSVGWYSRLLLVLAVRDLIHDRKVALCMVFSLVSVIAPLLLLFGLKNGIVGQLRSNLLNDPRNLEIRMIGNGSYTTEWLIALSQRPDVAFSIPLTRALNTQADIVYDSQRFVTGAEMIPTAVGDPLLAGVSVPEDTRQVILSASAAHQLQVQAGDDVMLFISRKRQGDNERGQLRMRVSAVLDHTRFTRPAAFLTLPVLVAMEDFRDGFHAELIEGSEGDPAPARTTFAKARLYARHPDAVAPLAEWFRQQHIETVTQLGQIESVRAIDYVLGMIFGIIAWLSLSGGMASLVGAFLANVDRKRTDMAILRLLGFYSHSVAFYMAFQALILSGVAFFIGCLLYLAASALFNQLLGQHLPGNTFICHLDYAHFLIALTGTLLMGLLVAGMGALRAMNIQPAESLREI